MMYPVKILSNLKQNIGINFLLFFLLLITPILRTYGPFSISYLGAFSLGEIFIFIAKEITNLLLLSLIYLAYFKLQLTNQHSIQIEPFSKSSIGVWRNGFIYLIIVYSAFFILQNCEETLLLGSILSNILVMYYIHILLVSILFLFKISVIGIGIYNITCCSGIKLQFLKKQISKNFITLLLILFIIRIGLFTAVNLIFRVPSLGNMESDGLFDAFASFSVFSLWNDLMKKVIDSIITVIVFTGIAVMEDNSESEDKYK